MIQNLNQMSFRGFGTILPERMEGGAAAVQEGARHILRLTYTDAVDVLRAAGPTWLVNQCGMTVLSVSANGEDFRHYYLDKPVCVQEGIFFSVSAFRQESTASMTCAQEPAGTGKKLAITSFTLSSRVRVQNLYTFFYQEREKGFVFPGESHPMLELTYVDHGILHSVADGQDLQLGQGDMALYGPNQWHMQYANVDVAASFVTITFDLEGADPGPLLNRKLSVPQEAAGLLQRMLREQERDEPYAADMIMCLLSQFMLIALREQDAPETRLRTGNAVHSENEIIRRAQQYISTHIYEKLTVPVVAMHADVSASYLTALFHKNLQLSPGEYIRRVKLQQSKQMIRENSMNFTEIAAALKYSTVHHFSRQFKEKFGITPSEYAKSVR